MSKGSGRRKEDIKKVESNPFWENTTFAKKKKEKYGNKSDSVNTQRDEKKRF
jgi:hypothetical protein